MCPLNTVKRSRTEGWTQISNKSLNSAGMSFMVNSLWSLIIFHSAWHVFKPLFFKLKSDINTAFAVLEKTPETICMNM